MPVKSILVHAEPGDRCDARLACAADLARRFDALLMGVGAQQLQSAAVFDPFGMLAAEFHTALAEQLQADLAAAEQSFRRHAAGLKAEWRAIAETPTSAVARVARGADLIVAGGAPLEMVDVFKSLDVAELAITAGRPVLVAPPQAQSLKGEGVVVAWKDTREARRALADALPFLKVADRVVVLEVCDADRVEAATLHAEEVVAHLGRHGVRATSMVLAAPDDQVAAELHGQAEAIEADLIVSGCYGHSRLKEWAFGGVTKDLLRRPERFLLLSH